MTFLNFCVILLIVYAVYYSILLLFEITKKKVIPNDSGHIEYVIQDDNIKPVKIDMSIHDNGEEKKK